MEITLIRTLSLLGKLKTQNRDNFIDLPYKSFPMKRAA